MSLPYPSMDFTPFDTLPAESLDQMVANIEALAAGTGLDDEVVTNAKLADSAVTPERILAGTGTSWAWQDWTPTYTDVTPGNGTVTAKYIQIGKTVIARWQIVCGSTTVIINNHQFSYPVTPASSYSAGDFDIAIGTASANDISGNVFAGIMCAFNDSGTKVIRPTWHNPAGSVGQVSGTFPLTEASGDLYGWTVMYEAA